MKEPKKIGIGYKLLEMNGEGKSGNGMDSYLILRCLNLIFYMEEILKVGLDTPNNVVFS